MKSNKQRSLEIKTRRRNRAKALKADPFKASNSTHLCCRPLYSVVANHAELAHNNTYGPLPFFYLDRPFNCKDCGAHEVWTARNQKWWFEIAKGNIDSTAIHCLNCRTKRRNEKQQQKAHMEEMANREPHPNEAFFKRH